MNFFKTNKYDTLVQELETDRLQLLAELEQKKKALLQQFSRQHEMIISVRKNGMVGVISNIIHGIDRTNSELKAVLERIERWTLVVKK